MLSRVLTFAALLIAGLAPAFAQTSLSFSGAPLSVPPSYARPTTASNSSAGNVYIDALLYTLRWNAPTSTPANTIAYSSPGAGNTDAGCTLWTSWQGTPSTAMQAAIDQVYRELAQIVPLTFTKITEVAAGPHALIRYGKDVFGGSFGEFPGSWCPPGTGIAGTVEIGPDAQYGDFYTVPGRWSWWVMHHETSHTNGFTHPFSSVNVNAGPMPSDQCFLTYTVMAYHSSNPGGTLCPTGGSPADPFGNQFPTTMMRDDVAAWQAAYGAYNPGPLRIVHTFSPTTGEYFQSTVSFYGGQAPAANIIYMNITDGSGQGDLSLSNYSTNPVIDLRPGSASSIINASQLAIIDGGSTPAPFNFSLSYNTFLKYYEGSSGNDDVFSGSAGFTSGGHVADGGTGANTWRVPGTFASYTAFLFGPLCVLANGSGGGDILLNFQTVIFSDATKSLNTTTCVLS